MSYVMNYEIITETGNYALLLRNGKEYAVVEGLNKERKDWNYTCCYYIFGASGPSQAEALSKAVDAFLSRTVPGYIPRARLEELATLFKDGLVEDDEASARIFFEEICKMTDEEKDWFGI